MQRIGTLSQLREGETGCVCALLSGADAPSLERLGLIVGTKILCLRRSPLGDPTAYALRGTVFALRQKSTDRILISLREEPEKAERGGAEPTQSSCKRDTKNCEKRDTMS